MFVFNAKQLLREIEINSPGMVEACEAALRSTMTDLDFIRLDEEHFSKCESISIDYALMEKTNNAALVPLNAGWNDIGSWDSLWNVTPKDLNGNVLIGDVLSENSTNSFVHATQKLTTLLGVDDLVVVDTDDALLIANKEVVLSENESVYIPIGEKHRLSNPGKIPLKIIEVQSGSYLGEDDIVRFEDDYHREE